MNRHTLYTHTPTPGFIVIVMIHPGGLKKHSELFCVPPNNGPVVAKRSG